MTQLSGLFWLARHFGQTVRLCVGTRQWQPAAGRAVGGVASDQLWHAVCIWTNAHMLTRRVPNSRARQSASHCPLSAWQGDGGGVHLLLLSPLCGLLFQSPGAPVMCSAALVHFIRRIWLLSVCFCARLSFPCSVVECISACLCTYGMHRFASCCLRALACVVVIEIMLYLWSAASFSTISRVRLASLWKTEHFWAWKTSHVHSWPIRPLQSGEEEQRYGAFIHKLLLLKFR